MKFLFLAFLPCLAFGLPFKARAETDQLCLKQCVAAGASSLACLSQCSYRAQKTPKALNNEPLSPRVLKAPIPVDKTVLPAQKAPAEAPEKDYACFRQCLQTKKTYALCEAACIKKACKSGNVLCNQRRK